MSCDSAAAIRSLLEQSVKQIAERLAEHDVAGDHAAFTSFRRAVQHASSGRYATPAQLLGDLEPKVAVCSYLAQLFSKRKAFRRQIEAVLMVLVQVDGWLLACQDADLPSELKLMLKEEVMTEQGEPSATSGPSRLQTGVQSASPDDAANGCSGAQAGTGPAQHTAPADAPAMSSLALLEKGRQQIEALSYTAANSDDAIAAFEVFRKAVAQVVQSETKEDDKVLEQLEPKPLILQFLVNIYECMRKYHARVASVLIRLLAFDSWRLIAEADDSIYAAVCQLISSNTVNTAERPSRVKVTLQGASVTMRSAAEAAVSQGGVGAVYIRVVAGHNLIPADANGSSDPYVRLWLGPRMKRTHIVCNSLNPRWDAQAFVMQVPAFDTALRFEVLDDDVVSADPLGELLVRIVDLPTELNRACSRHKLSAVPHGELELELLFVPGSSVTADQHDAISGTAENANNGQDGSATLEANRPSVNPDQSQPFSADITPERAGICRGACILKSCSVQ